MNALLLFVGGYFVVLAVLLVAARPYRVRLVQLGTEILNDTDSEDVRRQVRDMLRSAYSIRTAPVQLLSYCVLLYLPHYRLIAMAQEFVKEHDGLLQEQRFSELFDLHRASAAAVNPIFGALAYLAKAAFRMKVRFYSRRYHADRTQLKALQMRTV